MSEMSQMLRIILFRIMCPLSEEIFKLTNDVMVTGDNNANIRKKIAPIVSIEN
jgi:hypothetical protein